MATLTMGSLFRLFYATRDGWPNDISCHLICVTLALSILCSVSVDHLNHHRPVVIVLGRMVSVSGRFISRQLIYGITDGILNEYSIFVE